MTLGKFRLSKQVRSLEQRKPDELMEVPGSLGLTVSGTRLVEIPNRPGYVYVRIRDQLSEVVQVYNDQVSPIYNLPVIITRNRTDMNRWRIKGRDLGRYEGWGSTAYLPNHGGQHSLSNDAPGADPVWVYARQMMPLAAVPSGTSGAMSLIVKDLTYYQSSTWHYFPDTVTSDFTSYKPSGTASVMVLLYLNDADALAYKRGTEFAITTGTSAFVPNIPASPTDCLFPIAGVYLLSGTSHLDWSNIYDARPHLLQASTGTSTSSTDEKVKVSSDDTTANYLASKVVAGVGVSVTTLGGAGNETLSIAVTNTGTSSSGHVIQEEGSPLTARANLNFVGTGVTATDDAGNDATKVTINLTTGSSVGSSFYPAFVKPDVGTYTWVNQSSGSASNSYAGIYLYTNPDPDQNFNILKKAAPSVPYAIDVAMLLHLHNVDNNKCGLLFRENATGYIHAYLITNQNCMMLSSKLWNPSAWNDNYGAGVNIMPISGLLYLRIEDNNTNRVCSWSTNGQDFTQFHSIARNDWFVADEVGFFVESQNVTYPAGVTILSWYEH
jgi:hypothetical protein